jgi:hypothetical protein
MGVEIPRLSGHAIEPVDPPGRKPAFHEAAQRARDMRFWSVQENGDITARGEELVMSGSRLEVFALPAETSLLILQRRKSTAFDSPVQGTCRRARTFLTSPRWLIAAVQDIC